ncbi:hypothetical protein [Rhizobium laguerreae]|uniref:hypothetical protein n=1 Tax=Rhizobium laguerreae TaxID=1076926 RepID=UPI001038B50B|nr:hypothetical protein [Rhizobium laguerreae]TBY12095.1 hypothetical protein E0J21_06520 [Rhizobium laguerreae]
MEPGLTLTGLRHTVATILREMGEDYEAIAEVLGLKTEATANTILAEVGDFEVEVNRRKTKRVSNTETGSRRGRTTVNIRS